MRFRAGRGTRRVDRGGGAGARRHRKIAAKRKLNLVNVCANEIACSLMITVMPYANATNCERCERPKGRLTTRMAPITLHWILADKRLNVDLKGGANSCS